MLNVNKILLVVLVVLIIAGLSMEANAGERSKVDYNLTCGVLALGMDDEPKAQHYADLLPSGLTDEYITRVVREVYGNIVKYAEVQGVSNAEVAGYAFKNYGCDRPFI